MPLAHVSFCNKRITARCSAAVSGTASGAGDLLPRRLHHRVGGGAALVGERDGASAASRESGRPVTKPRASSRSTTPLVVAASR
jgi:hypothetical protein